MFLCGEEKVRHFYLMIGQADPGRLIVKADPFLRNENGHGRGKGKKSKKKRFDLRSLLYDLIHFA